MLTRRQNKIWLKPKNILSLKIPSRNIEPVCGPPRFPLTKVQRVLIGGGSIFLMMIIPIWGTYNLPSWGKKHQNLGKAPKEN